LAFARRRGARAHHRRLQAQTRRHDAPGFIEFASRIGIEVDDYDTEAGSETLDNDPEVADYAVLTLPVED
jgi:hypothetical protein